YARVRHRAPLSRTPFSPARTAADYGGVPGRHAAVAEPECRSTNPVARLPRTLRSCQVSPCRLLGRRVPGDGSDGAHVRGANEARAPAAGGRGHESLLRSFRFADEGGRAMRMGVRTCCLLFVAVTLVAAGCTSTTPATAPTAKQAKAPTAGPRLEIKQTSQDAGEVDFSIPSERKFPVRNVGDEPLLLTLAAKSCFCT